METALQPNQDCPSEPRSDLKLKLLAGATLLCGLSAALYPHPVAIALTAGFGMATALGLQQRDHQARQAAAHQDDAGQPLPVFVHDDEALYVGECSPIYAALLAHTLTAPRNAKALDLGDVRGFRFVAACRFGRKRTVRVVVRLNDAVFSLTAEAARKQAGALAMELVSIQPQWALGQAMIAALETAADQVDTANGVVRGVGR